jgi:protein CpxP
MKLLQNTKFTGPAILLLLILNSTLLVLLLVKHPEPKSSSPPMEHGGPRDFLVHELNMDTAQQRKYDTLIKFHRAAMNKIQDDIRTNRDSLVSQLNNANFDTLKINSFAAKIGNDQSQIEKVTFHHFRRVREICTPQQQPKFDSVIREALRMMGPPPPGGPHGPPPPMNGNPPPGQGPPPDGNPPPPPR